MKQADVVVGEEYACYVGSTLRIVRVLRKDTREDHRGRKRTDFWVMDPKTGKVLPSTRTAAALRPVPPYLRAP